MGTIDPQNVYAPKLCKGLLSHQRRGRFGTTLENFWAVLALYRYFKIYEGEEPNFETRLWVGKASNERTFKGRSNKTLVSNAKIEESGELLLLKSGPGRLYYDVTLSMISAKPNLQSKVYGLGIKVRLNGVENDHFEYALGDIVKVEVQIHVPVRRNHVAITSPFAGGMELFDGSGRPGRTWWCDHMNRLDDRVEWFSKEMGPGLYKMQYQVCITTSGTFLMRSARAECMYREDIYGSSPDIRIVIKEKN